MAKIGDILIKGSFRVRIYTITTVVLVGGRGEVTVVKRKRGKIKQG